MKYVKLYIFIVLMQQKLMAIDYYVSNDGNDSNNGKSPTAPWKTLNKLNLELYGGSPLGPGNIINGDRVFLRRGDTFRGQISLLAYNNNNITIGAYGVGNKPNLKGSKKTSNWTVHSGNIWKTTIPETVQFLYLDNEIQTLARYPNSGYLYSITATTTTTNNNLISSSDLNFVGSNICMREHDWKLCRKVISSQSGISVNYPAMATNPGSGRNFYFDNKLSFLDTDGEWYYDTTTMILYFKVASDVNPNNLNIEASVYDFGVYGNDNRLNLTIENLSFSNYGDKAISLNGFSNYATVQNCEFDHNLQSIFIGGNNTTLINNILKNAFSNNLEVSSFGNGLIKSNSIIRTGMIFGLHRPSFTGEFHTHGILLFNGIPGGYISENIVDQAGYIGIKFIGNGIIIEKNYVTNVMYNLNDGGALYTWGTASYNSIVRDNIIRNVVGNVDGVSANGVIAHGIYIDNYAHNITVVNNTVLDITGVGNSVSGILVNAGSYNNIVRNNLTYNCGMVFSDYWYQNETINNNRVARNVFYSIDKNIPPLQNISALSRWNFGTLDSNYYCNPYSNYISIKNNFATPNYYTLSEWQNSNPGQEVNSKNLNNFLPPYSIVGTSGPELFSNGKFDSNINGWVCWSSAPTCISVWDNTAGFTTGAIKTTLIVPSNQIGFTQSSNISVTQNQWYVLRFKAKSSNSINTRLQLNRSHSDYAVLQYLDYIPLTSGIQSYEIFFQATISESLANISFRFEIENITYWLDDVSLMAVTIELSDPKRTSILFANPSNNTVSISLNGVYKDIDNQQISNINLPAWGSKVIISDNAFKKIQTLSSTFNPVSKISLNKYDKLQLIPITTDNYLSFILPDKSDVYQINIKDLSNTTVYSIPLYMGENINLQHLPVGSYNVELSGSKIKWIKKISLQY